MALKWIEGFETHINQNQLARKYASFSGTAVTGAGRVFGRAGSPQVMVAVTPSFGTDNTFVMGIGLRMVSHTTNVNSGSQGFYIETGVDEQCHIEIESHASNGFRFLIKRGSTTVATSSYFDHGVWHYFEFKITVRDGTDGAYEVRHNGVTDISGTSVNLADNATDGWDIFAFRYSSALSTFLDFDDIYILNGSGSLNNDFLGPCVVEELSPNAVGASSDWSPTSGSDDNYTYVDDDGASTPDEIGAGSSVGSDTNGHIDLYGFSDLQNITGTIHGIQLGLQMAMAASGTRTVRSKYRDPDTTVVNGTSHVVDSTAYDEFTEIMETNPNGSIAWDASDIDDGQFGVEVVS